MKRLAVDRRSFIRLSAAAMVPASMSAARGDDREDEAWWEECATSPGWRLIAENGEAEGLIVERRRAMGSSLTFIDPDIAVARPIVLPEPGATREVQVVGAIPYEMSWFGPDRDGSSGIVVQFAELARVSVYEDRSPAGGIVVVSSAA